MTDLTALSDLPTPASGDFLLTWRGVSPYRLNLSRVLFKDQTTGTVGLGANADAQAGLTIEGVGQASNSLTDAGNHTDSLFVRGNVGGVGAGGAVLFGANYTTTKPFAAIKGYGINGANNSQGHLLFMYRAAATDTFLTEAARLGDGGFFGIGCTPSKVLHVGSQVAVTSYNELAEFKQSLTTNYATYSSLAIAQISNNKMAIEARDNANTKGTLNLQPFGGSAVTGNAATQPGTTLVAQNGVGTDGIVQSYQPSAVSGLKYFRFFYTSAGSMSLENVNDAYSASTARFIFDCAALNFRAGSDNGYSLGTSGVRWTTVYAVTGTINTSDERLKKWRGALSEAELKAARQIAAEIGVYQWLDAIEEKGGDGARLHVGVRAQRVFKILEECGLDWRRYAWCCYDKWEAKEAVEYKPEVPAVFSEYVPPVLDDNGVVLKAEVYPVEIKAAEPAIPAQDGTPAGDRYGVRPDQLAMFLIAAQEQRITALEDR